MGDKKPKPIPNYMNFIFGGSAGMLASVVVHPLDVIKNRMQLSGMGSKSGASAVSIISGILKNEGPLAFYNGLTASLLRQATYTTTRLGVYNNMLEIMKNPDGTPLSFAMKAGLGMFAGACGAFVGTPAELCLIRMTADGRLPPSERRNYSHVGNALVRIVREEGLLTLWRGCIPTVVRACVVNGTQLASYSQAKQQLVEAWKFEENLTLHFTASMISGFATSLASLPVDIIKTRVQNMKTVNGVPEYKSSLDAFFKTIGKEGIFALWKGFIPYYARIGPHTVLTFIFLEQLTTLYRKM